MGLFSSLFSGSVVKRGMQSYKNMYFILNNIGTTDFSTKSLLKIDAVKALLMTVYDLRVIDVIHNLTCTALTRHDVPRHINDAIWELFRFRANEIIDTTTDVKLLHKMNRQLDIYAKKEKSNCNFIKSLINNRIDKLK